MKKDYTLDEGLPAASLENKPIKYTRTADDMPEKKGCGACLLAVLALPPLLLAAAWGPAWAAAGWW